MRRLLFLDRDGTLIIEPPHDPQIDQLEKLEFYPKVFQFMAKIAKELDFDLVMVTNQDGLGTAVFPEAGFWSVQNKVVKAFENEGVVFKAVHIDRSFPQDHAPTRKPRIGMLTEYLNGDYNLPQSFVIGDRLTDMELAKNLGTKGIWINNFPDLAMEELETRAANLKDSIVLATSDWEEIYRFLKLDARTATLKRVTKETNIAIDLNLDGKGHSNIKTGLGFFDHMLDQLARHSSCDLEVQVEGDLHIDEHHTIEDTAIALGEAFHKALGSKMGIERYGYCLPMDDCLAHVSIDFGGRNWIVWKAAFSRERIGAMPTEMFFHFFKSFSDAARCNLNISATGDNEHHKIEAIFKAFAKAIKMAKRRDTDHAELPSTKGVL